MSTSPTRFEDDCYDPISEADTYRREPDGLDKTVVLLVPVEAYRGGAYWE